MKSDKKWAFITGARRGLGRALAFEAAVSRYSLILHCGRGRDDLAVEKKDIEMVKALEGLGVEVECLYCDFSDWKDLQTVCHSVLSRTDIHLLVNCVGEFSIGAPSQMDVLEMERLFRVNFFSPCWLIQQLLPSLQREKGQIINIGSAGIGHVLADTFAPAYHLSKLSLLSWTKSLAKELAPVGVRVNMISPGKMENSVDLIDNGLADNGFGLPMRRPASLQEITALFRFLLSEEAGYITGQNIEIAGGFRLI